MNVLLRRILLATIAAGAATALATALATARPSRPPRPRRPRPPPSAWNANRRTRSRARRVYGRTPDAQLRLITCGGEFDRSTRHYVDNVVAFATLDRT